MMLWVSSGRLEVVVGDLALSQLGLGKDDWDRVASEADVVVHNGALVGPLSRSPFRLTDVA
jgi:L-aminoadipate-semialdehyde dehydrogenase